MIVVYVVNKQTQIDKQLFFTTTMTYRCIDGDEVQSKIVNWSGVSTLFNMKVASLQVSKKS